MTKARRLVAVSLSLLLAACGPRDDGRVDPARYDAFFLWAGVRPQPVLGKAKVVYLLAGEVRRQGTPVLAPLRSTPNVRQGEVWLTVRTDRLDWDERTWGQVLNQMAIWQAKGNRLAGLQIDFDASTRGIAGYAGFLRQARQRLPSRYRLSVTGLMDWSVNGDSKAVSQLRGVVDEVVIQTYQGRNTIPGYEAYLRRLSDFPVPFRIALVQQGDYREPAGLRSNPRFRGYVVFLVNP